MKEIITVYAESTPNPNTMKFVASTPFITSGLTVEYFEESEAENSPLSQRLFSFPFVKSLFLASNFVTVTRNDLVEWDDVVLELREYIQNYLQTGHEVFTKPPTATQHQRTNEEGAQEFIKMMSEPQDEVEESIINLLEEYVRPAVEGDGGAIHFKSFNKESGELTVKLSGACSGCPSSTATLKGGIQNLFNRMMPEVKTVNAEEV